MDIVKIVIIVVILFTVPYTMSQEDDLDFGEMQNVVPTWPTNNIEAGETAANAMANGETISQGTVTDMPVTIGSYDTVMNGPSSITEGRLTTESLVMDVGNFQNVEDLFADEDGNLVVAAAENLNFNDVEASGVQDFQGSEESVTIGHADTALINQIGLQNANTINTNSEGLGIGNADHIEGRDLAASGVSVSSMNFDGEGLDHIKIVSNSDNNTITFKDMSITLDKNDAVEITKKGRKYDVKITDGILRDDSLQVNSFEFSGRYEYRGNNYDPFAIEAENYKLFIRTSVDQDFDLDCDQCGLIDLVDKKVELKGQYVYQKLSLDPIPLFETIIESSLCYFVIAE